MQLKLDMSCHLLNVYTKFQIDISKHVEEKSGKRGRTDGRTDRRTDGRTLPRHNTSRFSNGRIKTSRQRIILYIKVVVVKRAYCSGNWTTNLRPRWLGKISFIQWLSIRVTNLCRDSKIAPSCVIYPLNLKRHQLSASWGHILKFPMNWNIKDGTHSQCSGTQKDHDPWVLGPIKKSIILNLCLLLCFLSSHKHIYGMVKCD